MGMIILACDSGIERTGYALFDSHGGKHELLAYDCIFTHKKDRPEIRLMHLHDAMESLFMQYKPDRCVLERLFFSKNVTTAMVVAQAQGVVMALAGQHGAEVDFLTPQEIKVTLTGHGSADKKSVQKMVKLLLHLDEIPQPDDTADAVACGLTYCTMRAFHDRQT